MNATIQKFGYPATLVADYTHWVVLLRPAQPTLGSLILAAKSDATAFGDIPVQAHTELKTVTSDIEQVLSAFTGYAKLNYLMLMMVDPHVHFHVIPRYEGSKATLGLSFTDTGWPKTPNLGDATSLSDSQITALARQLQSVWPEK